MSEEPLPLTTRAAFIQQSSVALGVAVIASILPKKAMGAQMSSDRDQSSGHQPGEPVRVDLTEFVRWIVEEFEPSVRLPGGAGRFKAGAQGVKATIVNGVPVIVDGVPTGALPGHTVRPSRIS